MDDCVYAGILPVASCGPATQRTRLQSRFAHAWSARIACLCVHHTLIDANGRRLARLASKEGGKEEIRGNERPERMERNGGWASALPRKTPFPNSSWSSTRDLS